MVLRYTAAITTKAARKKLIDLVKLHEASLQAICWTWNAKSCELRCEGSATTIQTMYTVLEEVMNVS